jgi:16S rRNA (cytidine1402-2'-O)-methyltransferase
MDRVAFEGFLPSKPKARRDALAALAREPRTMAFYEAPHRVAEALADMRNAFGPERRACVARELTKVHEEFERAGLGELADRWARREPRGEFTILVEGTPPETGVSGSDVESAVRAAMARGATVSETAREVSAALGCPRKLAYELALRLKGR